jgi:hypothetical protein
MRHKTRLLSFAAGTLLLSGGLALANADIGDKDSLPLGSPSIEHLPPTKSYDPVDAGPPKPPPPKPPEPAADGGVVDGGLEPFFPPDGGSEAGTSGDALAPTAPTAPSEAELEAKALEEGADHRTGIRGRILDHKTSQPLKVAPILAQGADGRTRTGLTDEHGAFQLYLPPGVYTLRSYYSMYHGVRMPRVRVTRGAFTSTRLVLDPIDVGQDVAVAEIEIPYRADTTTIAAQDQLRKESKGIGEGMGAQQMSQQGAGDAGAAARRVVGVTMDGSQLVIRGLGGRYVRVFLNGLPIPNTDPDFPSVDLDLFPTQIIDNLNIQKVFLPETPGDFAGGVLDINTVSFPRKFMVSAGIGAAYNSETTFRKMLTYKGGSYDWLGYDDGTRALPGVVQDKKLIRPTRQGGPFPTLPEFEAAGEQFKNIWNTQRTTALPQMGFNLTVGNSINFAKKRRIGYLASIVYEYAAERQTGVNRPRPAATSTGDAEKRAEYQVESGTQSVQLSAIGTGSIDLGVDHSVTLLTLFNRSMDDQTRFRTGNNPEYPIPPYESWQFRFLGRTIFVNQLLGDHRNLGGTRLRLRWSGFYDQAQRDEPDQRVIRYGNTSGVERRWIPTADRLWSDLKQQDYGGTAQLRFPLWAEAWGTVGGRAVITDREFNTRRFVIGESPTSSDASFFRADPETIFNAENMGPRTQTTDFTKDTDSYTASQQSYAGFLSVETPIVGRLSATGGARLEAFKQTVQSRSPFASDNTAERLAANRTQRTDIDVLPGVALKYALSELMILRAAYGITLSRPQVRELAPYDYYDFLRDRLVIGNPDLKTAKIHNVDLRWEWFFGEGQVLAVSGFYKKFYDPIELGIVRPETGDSQYQNAKGATNFGAEVELRSDLARLAKALRRLTFSGNLSLIDSKIDLVDTGATRNARRLAGQAPYVINLSLRCSFPEIKTSLGLVYNVVGPRIVDVGARVTGDLILPDVIEQPFNSLDLIASKGLPGGFSLKFKARNLLFQHRVLKQGTLTTLDLNSGITLSLGLGYDY